MLLIVGCLAWYQEDTRHTKAKRGVLVVVLGVKVHGDSVKE